MDTEGKDTKKWVVIYPVYLNAKKTIAEGRKIGVSNAVDNPTSNEISEVCKFLGFECIIEPDKAYARDYTLRGRVRVRIKDETGPFNAEIKTKNALLIKLGSLIPKLQSRVSGASTAATTTTKPGKKGKKK